MRPDEIRSEADWERYEARKWQDAMRERGLKPLSLSREEYSAAMDVEEENFKRMRGER